MWKSYLLCTDSVRGFDHSVYTCIDDGYDAPFYVRYLPHHGLNLIDPILFHTLHLLKKEKTFCYFVYMLFLHPFWQLNLITVTTWSNDWWCHRMKLSYFQVLLICYPYVYIISNIYISGTLQAFGGGGGSKLSFVNYYDFFCYQYMYIIPTHTHHTKYILYTRLFSPHVIFPPSTLVNSCAPS